MKVLVVGLREAQFAVCVAERNAFQKVDHRWISGRCPLCSCGDGRLGHASEVAQACALVRSQEERFVLNNRAANSSAKLVSLELVAPHVLGWRTVRQCQRRSPISCVEYCVSHKFERCTVQRVSSRFGDHIHDCARILPVFRTVITCLDAEFLKRIRVRKRLIDIGVLVYVVAAIELITDLVLPRTIHIKSDRSGESFSRALVSPTAGALNGAGCRESERGSVAAIQWQFCNTCLLDHVLQRRSAGVDLYARACYLDDFCGRSQLQMSIDGE